MIDHWWQTESGWAIGANCVGLGALPVKQGSPTKAVPGYRVHVVDDNAREMPRGEIGAIVIKLPLPPGCLPTLWNNDEGFKESYLDDYPGYYPVGDAEGLANLLLRAESEPEYLAELKEHCVRLRPRFTPEGERAAWQELLSGVLP